MSTGGSGPDGRERLPDSPDAARSRRRLTTAVIILSVVSGILAIALVVTGASLASTVSAASTPTPTLTSPSRSSSPTPSRSAVQSTPSPSPSPTTPAGPDIVSFTQERISACDNGSAQVNLAWATRGAVGVAILADGASRAPNESANGQLSTSFACDGASHVYTLRAVDSSGAESTMDLVVAQPPQ